MEDSILPLIDWLKKDGLLYFIVYGSYIHKKGGSGDIDIVAICDEAEELERIRLGSIDLIKIEKKTFEYYASMLDPAYCTEPILTGRLFYGDPDEYELIKQRLINKESTPSIVSYLLVESFKEHLKAISFCKINFLLDSYFSLSFSISYRLFAQWYLMGGKAIPLKQLVARYSDNSFISNFFDRLKEAKTNRSSLEKEEIKNYINSWEKIILLGPLTVKHFY